MTWTVVGTAVKEACMAANPELAGGELIKAMIAHFDTTGEEKITAEGLLACATAVGCELSAEDAAAMIASADKDADGAVDAFEFEQAVMDCL